MPRQTPTTSPTPPRPKTDIANAKRFVGANPQQYVRLADYYHDAQARPNLDTLRKLEEALRIPGWLAKPVNVNEMVDLRYLPK